MKNKPMRHKESNVFRFKRFGDRIGEIDLRRNALYHIKHVNEEIAEDVDETEFYQTYCKWTVLNLTEEYAKFQRKIRSIVTLPQLLHKKEFVIETLHEAIENGTNLSLQPILEHVVAAARDLREEFYPYFESFLARLIRLLGTKDADLLEWTLVCLAHLFKILKPFLKKNLAIVLKSVFPLLDDRNPEHITNFAAECFSFVARDVKDKNEFLALLLSTLHRQTNGVSGCARLIAEMVRGVNGLFHSCAESFLRLCFESLSKPDQFDIDELQSVLVEFVADLLTKIQPGNLQTFWDVSIQTIELWIKESTVINDNAIQKMLELIGIVLETRDGKFLANSNQLVSILVKVIGAPQVSEDCLSITWKLVAATLLAKNLTLTQLDASRMCEKVVTISSSTIFETFVWNCVDYSQFELLIFPKFLNYLDGKHFNVGSLELMAKIVQRKSPLCGDGHNLNERKVYPIRMRTMKSIEKIEKILMNAKFFSEPTNEWPTESVREFLSALIVYPHIIGVDGKAVEKALKQLIDLLLERLNPQDEEKPIDECINEFSENKKVLFVLSILIETQIILSKNSKTVNELRVEKFVQKLLPFAAFPNFRYILGLRLLDLILTYEASKATKERSKQFNRELFVEVHTKLCGNLSSRYHEVRLLTTHAFDQFAAVLGMKDSDYAIYSSLYAIESVEANTLTYRQQLLHFKDIECKEHLLVALRKIHAPMQYDVLKYLLGLLHVNFKLLWQPIVEHIEQYFLEFDNNDFWPIFKEKLEETTSLLRLKQSDDVRDDETFIDGLSSWIGTYYCECWENKERPADLINYRIQLWQILPTLGNISEVKNREIVTIFLDFVELEFQKVIDQDTFKWNIRKKANEIGEEAVADDDDIDLDVDEPNANANVILGAQRTLSAMLKTFSGQANPKAMHREPELWNLYMDLLGHRNAVVQKLALDCIVAYKHKYLQPYKDHLYELIDDAKFKSAIVEFKVDKEASAVQAEHRNQLMPLLMRILFAKMVQRVNGQKGANHVRKSIVMRFLGGCHEDEILMMLHMSFWMFESHFKEDAVEMCESIINSIDLASVLSPKKLQSSLGLIDVIQNEFSGLMSPKFLRYILNLLLTIGSIAAGVLCKHEINPNDSRITGKMAGIFKSLRATCILNVQRFFQHFEKYPWTNNEIQAIFMIFVEPLAAKLPSDGVSSVTPMLKLFTTFAKFPRLLVLLTRETSKESSTDSTPLKFMMDLLLETKTRPLVCLAIMESIQNLLTLNDNESESTALSIDNCRPIDEDRLKMLTDADSLNFGSKMLLPYLPQILLKFKQNIKKKRGLTRRDLFILSRITELINDASTCSTLLTVLLPIFERKSHSSAGEEALMQMVETIINLFAKVERPERFIRNIAPMFQQITAVGPRKRLCELLQIICDRCDDPIKKKELKTIVEVVNGLNAWNRRFVEQPDYEERLMTFKRITALTKDDAISVDLGLLIIYHSFHFLKYDKDLAIRDSAAYHLKTLVPSLIRRCQRIQPQEVDYLIGQVILNLVRRSLRDSNDSLRNEAIQLLGEMARECSDAHPVLADLYPLTCKSDREIDFFDNVTHLQSMRHGRALLRFCTVAKTYETTPNPRTLTQFILPLASRYLSNSSFTGNHNVATAAIDTVGAVCHLLPWHQYEGILRFYLKMMRTKVEFQQQTVRIVRAILDAFHFDLSRANVKSSELPVPIKAEENEEDEIEKAAKAEEEEEKSVNKKTKVMREEGEEDVILDDGESDDEHFDNELDEINANDEKITDAEDEIEPPTKKIKSFVYDKPIVLTQSLAKKVIQTIVTGLIPTLNNSITALSTYETFHKTNRIKRRSERAEEEILRVPIALAMVKLLQKLPPGMLEKSLSGILIKVCQFLRSPLISVRRTTREILKDIMKTVGADHLETLLSHMTSLLTRGFQVHVLTITVHYILDELRSSLRGGIMDACLQCILEVCLRDIFGQISEEKEISKIGSHTPEAKPHNKSFLTLEICASNISESCLLDLLVPFKDQLQQSQSKKIVVRVQDCFQKIVNGLIANKQISIESMLMFVYGTISESIPDLLPGTVKPKLTEKEREKIHRARPDCFLIPEDPAAKGRTGAIKKTVVTNVRANAHVIIEFGLQLLQATLGRGKLLKINYKPFIDPIVPILCESLKSTHVRVTTFAFTSLSTMMHKEIKSSRIESLTPSVVEQVFAICHKYVAANTDMSNENFELVQSAFKTIVNVIRCLESFELNEEQLKTLLFYVEQYLNIGEPKKQKIAFSLLKAILGRQLRIPQLNAVLMQVARLSIQSEADHTRQNAKAIIVNYLMDYPLGKKVDAFVEFFLSNLNYELQSGRESAINILNSIAKRFPVKYLNRQAGLIFVTGGTRLINDDSSECRQQMAELIETLILRIDVNNRDELFAIVLTLLKDQDRASHREMGAILCTRFMNVEKQNFEKRIDEVLSTLISAVTIARTGINQTEPGQFVRVEQTNENEDDESGDDEDDDKQAEEAEKQRAIDHQLIQTQNTILKMLEKFTTKLFTNYSQYVDEIAYESQKLLAYEHVWVRLNAMKTLQVILQNIDADEIHRALINTDFVKSDRIPCEYLFMNPEQEIKSLTLDLCAQLVPNETDQEISDAATTNLLFVANMLKSVPFGSTKDDNDVDEEAVDGRTAAARDKRSINLAWLLRRMRYVIHAEVAKSPQNIVLRTSVFHWIEGLIELLSNESIDKLAYTILSPLVREMSEEDQNINPKLRNLAVKVGESIRAKIGDDEYNLLRAQIQRKFMIKRAERKKQLAMEKVSDPVRAAKRSQSIKDRKKVAKRKRNFAIREKMLPKKKRKIHENDF